MRALTKARGKTSFPGYELPPSLRPKEPARPFGPHGVAYSSPRKGPDSFDRFPSPPVDRKPGGVTLQASFPVRGLINFPVGGFVRGGAMRVRPFIAV